jgi:hypothetical protein
LINYNSIDRQFSAAIFTVILYFRGFEDLALGFRGFSFGIWGFGFGLWGFGFGFCGFSFVVSVL